MFDTLSDRLGNIFDKLKGRGVLEDRDLDGALREVRIALLEADVALPVVKDFIAGVRKDAAGTKVLRSVSPGKQVVKIVHDALVRTLGGGSGTDLNLSAVPPAAILMAGLQGSGKTTSTAKIALRLQEREKKRVLMASLDTYRPAAQKQLEVLGEQSAVRTLPVMEGQRPPDIARRAMDAARLGGYDVVLLDTAGRLSVDEQMMAEIAQIHKICSPVETLLVVDALTGQDALETAEKFRARIPVTGVVMTRMDADARGGAALSMRAVTGAPVRFAGTGEKITALDVFDPERMAGRILGMGDIVSLVEKAADQVDEEDARKAARRMAKGDFGMDDLAGQFRQMRRMGGMGAILGLIPGMGKMKKMLDVAKGADDREIIRQEAIISSMTIKERRLPALMNASRKKRVAAGSGTSVQEINRLLKAHRQMADMMKKMGPGGMDSMVRQLAGGGANPLSGAAGPGGNIDFDALGSALSGTGSSVRGMPGAGGKTSRKKKRRKK